jgi:hypothetical protein
VLDGDLRAILVANGGCPSRLLVFDATGTLVYDEVFDAYATLLVPRGTAASFLVASRDTIFRYSPGLDRTAERP